jgi:hypothetical protein
MGAVKLYMSPAELRTVGAACVLVAVSANQAQISVAEAAINDQLRKHADQLLAQAPMDPPMLKDFGLALIAQAAEDG